MHCNNAAHIRLRQLVWPIVTFAVFIYFLFYLLHGDRGYVSYQEIQSELRSTNARLQAVQEERSALSRRVKLMRPDTLARDMLEQQVRSVLGYSDPGEVIILE